ncbi:MAG: hypothetical protein WA913_14570 [Pricia sp.]
MKKIPYPIKIVFAFILLLQSAPMLAQEAELEEYFQDMKEILTTVESNGRTYRQSIEQSAPGNLRITVNETNEKGGESEIVYTLSLSDINPRATRSFPKGNMIWVEVVAEGNRRLFKKSWEGGAKIAYIPDFILYAPDVDNGGDLAQAFQESVPFAKEVEEKSLSLKTYDDHVDWLTSEIGRVKLSNEMVEQTLSVSSDGSDVVTLVQIKDGRKLEYVFNLSQLHSNSAQLEIGGDEIFIELRTKGENKAIKYSEDGRFRIYRNNIFFYANSLDQAKKMQMVLKNIIPLAEKEFKNAQPEFSSEDDMIRSINEDIKQVSIPEGRIQQRIDLDGNTAKVSIEEITDKRQLENKYTFSLTDINALGIRNVDSKSRLFLELPVKNGQPFIRHVENGVPQNFRDYFRMYFESREDALRAEDALKSLIKERQRQKEEAEIGSRMSLSKAWDNLETQVKAVELDDRSFEQTIRMVDMETSALQFNKLITDRKRTRELIYEFGAKDVNPFTAEIQVSGPRVWVELLTRNKNKTIKFTEDGELRNYDYLVEIEATSIANAKAILASFKFLSEKYNDRIGK